MYDWKTLNAEVIPEFRATGGKVARFGDLPVVILRPKGHVLGEPVPNIKEIHGESFSLPPR